MKHRLLPIFMLIFLSYIPSLGAVANVYMLSLFSHESITSTSNFGGKVTLGFGNDDLYGTTSLRMQHPKTNLNVHISKKVHGYGLAIEGMLLTTLDYFSYGEQNGATSLILAYALKASSLYRSSPTLLTASMGVHGTQSWSKSYEKDLMHLAPYVALAVTQTVYDRIFVNLFITTDPPSLQESDFSFCYGGSLALAVNENLMMVVRPLIRLSDFVNESTFVTMQEISYSICWTDVSARKKTIRELGAWL